MCKLSLNLVLVFKIDMFMLLFLSLVSAFCTWTMDNCAWNTLFLFNFLSKEKKNNWVTYREVQYVWFNIQDGTLVLVNFVRLPLIRGLCYAYFFFGRAFFFSFVVCYFFFAWCGKWTRAFQELIFAPCYIFGITVTKSISFWLN